MTPACVPRPLMFLPRKLSLGNTMIVAVAVLPTPSAVELTVTLLTCVPTLTAVTLTENVHDAPPARVPPVRPTVLDPAVAVIVPPPQLPARPLGVVTTSPAGRVSVKPTPARAVAAFG